MDEWGINSADLVPIEHWFCSSCTYQNLPLVSECTICSCQSPFIKAQLAHEQKQRQEQKEREEILKIKSDNKLAMLAELEDDFNDSDSDVHLENKLISHIDIRPPPRYHTCNSNVCFLQYIPMDVLIALLSYVVDSISLVSFRTCARYYLQIAEHPSNWNSYEHKLVNIKHVGRRHIVGVVSLEGVQEGIMVMCNTSVTGFTDLSSLNKGTDTRIPQSESNQVKKPRVDNKTKDDNNFFHLVNNYSVCGEDMDWYFIRRQHTLLKHIEERWMFFNEGWKWIKNALDELLWYCMLNTPYEFTGHRNNNGLNNRSELSSSEIKFQMRASAAKKEEKVTLIQCGSLPASPEEACFNHEKRIQFQRTCQKLLSRNWHLLRSSLLVLISLVAEGMARRVDKLVKESEKPRQDYKKEDDVDMKMKISFEVRWCWSVYQLWMDGIDALMLPLSEQIANQRDSDFANRRIPIPHLEDTAVSIFRHSFLLRPPILSLLIDLLKEIEVRHLCLGNSVHSFINEELGSNDHILSFVLEDAITSSASNTTKDDVNTPRFAALEALLLMLEKIDETPDAENARLVIGGGGKPARSAGVALAPPVGELGNGARGLIRRTLLISLLIHVRRGRWRGSDGNKISEENSDLLLAGFHNYSQSAQRRRTFTQRQRK